MKNTKSIIILLAIALIIIIVYSAISSTSSANRIKNLTVDLKQNVDSLEKLQIQYDSINNSYNQLYKELEITKNQLTGFKTNMDSIISLHIQSVATLKKAIGTELEKQDSIVKRDSTEIEFRFQ